MDSHFARMVLLTPGHSCVTLLNNEGTWFIPSIPWSQKYTPVQDRLYAVCMDIPVLASGFLSEICSIPTIAAQVPAWCGCYRHASYYDYYARKYGLTAQCAPECTAKGVLPQVDSQGNAVKCKQSSCIIDNLKIRMEGTFAGAIKIDQVCAHCTVYRGQTVFLSGAKHRYESHKVVYRWCAAGSGEQMLSQHI